MSLLSLNLLGITSFLNSGVGLFILTSYIGNWWAKVKKPLIFASNIVDSPDKKYLDHLISQCPSLSQLFFPSLFFHNCHIQLIPFSIQSYMHKSKPPYSWEPETAVLEDGETTQLDWFPSIPNSSSTDSTPVLVMNHGIFCNSRDIPGQYYIGDALKRGWTVCVVNRRGHCLPLSKPKYNMFGCTSDLRHLISSYIRGRRPKAIVYMIGISAGSGIVARYMGEQGMDENGAASMSFCNAAFGVCPGYNIEICMGRMRPPYGNMLLNSAKEFHDHIGSDHFQACESYHACHNSSNLQEWLDNSWSLGGFSSQEEYYDKSNPMRVVSNIREPSIFVNSEDDPFCVIENVYDNKYIFDEGRAPGAAIVVTKTGSHCSFYEIGLRSWIERLAFEFFDAALQKKY